MISKSEIRFAARLVHLGLVQKGDMETVLRELDTQRRRRLDSSLDDILVGRGLVTKTEVPLIHDEDSDTPSLKIEGFRVVATIGEGGMSRVYRAVPARGRHAVALKVLRPHVARQAIHVERFCREAELLIEFDHPNLVKGHEVWCADGLHCFTMELVAGPSVQEDLDAGDRLDEHEALSVILQAARALAYLSERGITHRDVKPGNLLRGADGAVKLIDLGLAQNRAVEDPARPGTTVGTVQYLSPEQAQGADDLDVRADIYSLGVSLYQMVVGEVPFSGETDRDILRQQVFASLKSPRMKDRRVTPHLHYFIEKMMAKDRGLRYQDPDQLIRDIEEQIQGHEDVRGEAGEASPRPPDRPGPRAKPTPPKPRGGRPPAGRRGRKRSRFDRR